jgi:uncharacterized cupredoxin-like copper-binding protein
MLTDVHLTRRRLLFSVVPAALGGSVLAACGSSGRTVTATANDFNFKFSTTSVSPGKVHFVLQNQSKTYKHELWVYPQDQPKLQQMLTAKDTSTQNGDDVDEKDYLQNLAGSVEDLDPGKTASFDTTLQPGTYEMACFVTTNIAGKSMVHYEMGMHALLTVH